jgi:hypothetical protein
LLLLLLLQEVVGRRHKKECRRDIGASFVCFISSREAALEDLRRILILDSAGGFHKFSQDLDIWRFGLRDSRFGDLGCLAFVFLVSIE